MNIPGFTAEASLYKTRKPYGMAATFEASEVRAKLYLQRVSGPWGPIGLPGQDCLGACLHICMTFGGGAACRDSCLSTCHGTPGGLFATI
jgi:hypothetical protein